MQHRLAKAAAATAAVLGVLVASTTAAPQGSLFDWVSVRTGPPEAADRSQLANRQASLFVAFLHDTNPAAFDAMMRAILDGRPFVEAVETGYQTDLQALWLRFVRATAD